MTWFWGSLRLINRKAVYEKRDCSKPVYTSIICSQFWGKGSSLYCLSLFDLRLQTFFCNRILCRIAWL